MQFEKYPFEKLNNLLEGVMPPKDLEVMTLTIGEPQLETPLFIQEELKRRSSLLNKYPKSAGEKILKDAVLGFVKRRFNLSLLDEELILTFGTREALFNFPQFLLSDKRDPVMAFTNPFYQIYEGAAIASGAEVFFLNLTKQNSFKPKMDRKILEKCDLVILNFPNNPTASVLSLDELKEWAKAALEFDFVLLNDECYSEIYDKNPPPSLLEAAALVGNRDFKNILVVNSISKRSSAPGLRSGFIAGDREILKDYLRYRTYVGCASPLPLQYAAAKAWSDEEHVEKNREVYRENFKLAKEILNFPSPSATFYMWLEVVDDLKFTKELYRRKALKVLPGSFLSREKVAKGYVRVALVEKGDRIKEALFRLGDFLKEWA